MAGMVLGIDLGTSQIVISAAGRGTVLKQPTVAALDERGRLIACGTQAWEMRERTPDSLRVVCPVSGGAVADYTCAERLLKRYVRQVCSYKILKPQIVLTVPSHLTGVEQRSAAEVAGACGARRVLLMKQTVAAAAGAGWDVSDRYGRLVVCLGGGVTEAAVLSLGGLAAAVSERIGGNDLDEHIVRYVRQHHGLIIGRVTAQRIKETVGSAEPPETDRTMEVRGRHAVTGLPDTCTVTAREIHPVLAEPLQTIAALIQRTLETTPPELAGDVLNRGALLTGGGAMLAGIDRYLSRVLGVACQVADKPDECAARGAAASARHLGRISADLLETTRFAYHLSDTLTN